MNHNIASNLLPRFTRTILGVHFVLLIISINGWTKKRCGISQQRAWVKEHFGNYKNTLISPVFQKAVYIAGDSASSSLYLPEYLNFPQIQWLADPQCISRRSFRHCDKKAFWGGKKITIVTWKFVCSNEWIMLIGLCHSLWRRTKAWNVSSGNPFCCNTSHRRSANPLYLCWFAFWAVLMTESSAMKLWFIHFAQS